ncbi:MAG: PHP domain-containing protein [Actinomycetaceae bacterium]|nr:PHP domain-containing protein [Actinomycetaceae bacterium]
MSEKLFLNGLIDTHVHSMCSDGTEAPAEVMRQASMAGLAAIALTDHDTTVGWEEAASRVNAENVALIRGMEVTTRYEGKSVHMLAYLFDPDHEAVHAHSQRLHASRRERIEEMVDNISRDYPITLDDVLEVAGGQILGRPHIADALIAKGIVEKREDAFKTIISSRGKYYVPNKAPNSCEVIEWVTKAGGKAVFAHPYLATRNMEMLPKFFHDFAEAGLFGVEVNHRDNPEDVRPALREMAQNVGVEVFGSSDYHGAGKPNRLGENVTSPEVVARLEDGAALPILRPSA